MTSVPTPAQMKKYSDYKVTFETIDKRPKTKVNERGVLMKTCAIFHRIPSQRRFFVEVYTGLDRDEREFIEEWGNRLPVGGWASFPDLWFTIRPNGRYRQVQAAGYAVKSEFDFVEAELQMMLPSSIDMSVGINHIPVL